jgi:hypothetical protein
VNGSPPWDLTEFFFTLLIIEPHLLDVLWTALREKILHKDT